MIYEYMLIDDKGYKCIEKSIINSSLLPVMDRIRLYQLMDVQQGQR